MELMDLIAGPFWMTKVSDGLPNGILNTLH